MVLHGVFGVPLLGDRVAPRCTRADGFLVAAVRRNHVSSQSRLRTSVQSSEELLAALKEWGVDTVVCGGLSRDLKDTLLAQGIGVIDNVACTCDDVVHALSLGTLQAGYGFANAGGDSQPPGTGVPARPSALVDCLRCMDRGCLVGSRCPAGSAGVPADLPPVSRAMLDAARDIAMEERQLCRLSELIYFCLEMQYRKIGIAYCSDLSEAAQILGAVVSRFFKVAAVCCKVNGAEPPDADPAVDHARHHTCDPLAQADLLNRAGTELNVIAGLCVGADSLFARASRAPVTTLFTKDRMLANNAFAALYSERYLHESMSGAAGLRRADEVDPGGTGGDLARLRGHGPTVRSKPGGES
jgi:uncharacterized metal-binding protein/predicted Fe-Mo cluster-binding NifX family protein